MIISHKETLGGYRLEFCSQNDEEEKRLKEIEKEFLNLQLEVVSKLGEKKK